MCSRGIARRRRRRAREATPPRPAHPDPDAPSALSTTIDDDRGSGDASGSPDASTPAALRAHTVVMNPPFGTRRKGADMQFLRAALHVADSAVYSLHKTSTRAHIEKHAMLTLRAAKAEVLAELRYELPRVYAHHRKDVVEIEVDLWRFEPPEDGVVGGDQIEYSDDSDADSDEDWGVERDGAGAGANAGAGGRRVELNYQGERNTFCDRREVEPRRAGRSGGKEREGRRWRGEGTAGEVADADAEVDAGADAVEGDDAVGRGSPSSTGWRRRAPVYAPRGVVEKCNVILQNCPERAVARDFGARDPHRTRTSPRIARPFDSRSPPSPAFRRSPGVKIVFVSVGGGRAARPKRHPSPIVASRRVLPPRRDASSSPLTVLSTSMPSRRVSSVFTPSRA